MIIQNGRTGAGQGLLLRLTYVVRRTYLAQCRAGSRLVLELADTITAPIVPLAGFGGLRRGELLTLRCRHVDLSAGTVTVEQ
jgi:integrase